MKTSKLLAFGLILVIAVAVFFIRQGTAPDIEKPADSRSSAPRLSSEDTSFTASEVTEQPSTTTSQPTSTNASPIAEPSSSGPEKTRATRRDEIVTASGKRKTQIDPIASWSDTPPWPEGPRLFAEAETSARKYVNLRPDDIGELPRILADAEERIELRVNFPEGEPGERIHVEMPNGGAFADTDARGRIYVLPENRTLSFACLADDSRGYCNVKFLHRGHTRSLPVWVGELPEPAAPDSES